MIFFEKKEQLVILRKNSVRTNLIAQQNGIKYE